MSLPMALPNSREKIKIALLDTLAIALVYFIPSLSHLFSFPLYILEPMRIMLILALVHTRKENAYIIALTLPIFSFVVSGHPNELKLLLIMGELTLNVWLFFFLVKNLKNRFLIALFSIIVSKSVYYLAKYALISLALFEGELYSTPLWLQGVMTVVFSVYIFLFFKKDK